VNDAYGRTPEDWASWLYERAEDAAPGGLPLERALQAVRDGYSSIEADRLAREDP
jgi:hypothetical protein